MAHERSVFVQGLDGEHETWADPKDLEVLDPSGYEESRAQAVVNVLVVQHDEGAGRALVQLPSELVHGSRRLWVAASQLR